MKTIFNLPADHYKCQVHPLQSYLKQLAFYIGTMKSIPEKEALEKAKSILRSNYQDKTIKFFERQENQDREVKKDSLLKYIDETIKDKQILAPTFTTYLSKSQKRSMLSDFIAANVKRRSVAKKTAQVAKAEGDMLLHTSKNNEQNMMKIYNNSLSGAFAQEACVLINPTSHSTLTSVTRTVTSLANTSNESMLGGNRFYPTIDDVLNHVIYIASNANIEQIKIVVDKYQLHLPTVDDTVKVLSYSSNLYFYNPGLYEKHIVPFLKKLSVYHLAAICYLNDLYHLRNFNEQFFRNFILDMTKKIVNGSKDDSYLTKIYEIDENILNYTHQIFFEEVRGYGKDYKKMHAVGLTSSIYDTAMHVDGVLSRYNDMISAFLLSDIMPFNSHRIRHMRRRIVVLSDTDSTCFTLDKWVEWYNGQVVINPETIAVASSVAFLSTQVIIHLLAQLSANLNIAKEDINVLAMKNEFLWTIHIPAEVSKHYMAYAVMQEGSVHKEPEIEVKGVHLKSSAVPKVIIADGKDFMEGVLKAVHENKGVSLNDCIRRVIALETDIANQVRNGNTVYFKKSKVKNKEAYALEEHLSPFQRHGFWQDIFAPKYGVIKEPPYDVIVVPTTLSTKTKLKAWIDGIEDKELSARLVTWLQKFNKSTLPTIYLETITVMSMGIPVEIQSVIDLKRIILDISKQHRIILECLGVILDENLLVSEMFREFA